MENGQDFGAIEKKSNPPNRKNPFGNGFVVKKHKTYLKKSTLLKLMLEVDIRIQDLPTNLADNLREILPGWFEDVEKKFTMRQIMELVQLQLLFSKSDYVKQQAIEAIKDRVDGKAVQTTKVEVVETEPTEFVLPGGRIIVI